MSKPEQKTSVPQATPQPETEANAPQPEVQTNKPQAEAQTSTPQPETQASAAPQPATQTSTPQPETSASQAEATPKPKPKPKPKASAPQEKSKADAPKTKTALVIDDEPANRDFLVRLLVQANMEVKGAKTGAEALAIAETVEHFSLIAIDNKLPDMNGVELLVKFREKYPEAKLVMATMLDERKLMTKAFENGCDVFLVKPHGFMELFRRLQESTDKLDQLIIDQYGPRPYRG